MFSGQAMEIDRGMAGAPNGPGLWRSIAGLGGGGRQEPTRALGLWSILRWRRQRDKDSVNAVSEPSTISEPFRAYQPERPAELGADDALGAGDPLEAAAGLRLALLTNSLSPHSVALCEQISQGVGAFRAFLSAPTDAYHGFPRAETSFPVTVQQSWNALRPWRRVHGAWQASELHIPYDTLAQLRAFRPGMIVTSQLGLRTALAVLYGRLYPETRVVLWATLSQHTEARRGLARRLLRRWIVRHVHGAFVNGRGGEDYLRQMGYRGALECVPYAIEDSPFRSEVYQPKKGSFRLVYAGQMVAQKGLGEFCAALVRWCSTHPEVRVEFVMVGNGPRSSALQRMTCPPNLRLRVLPRVPQSRLAAHYRSADLFAFPTLGDEWGVVVNEAMLAGLPVLGSIYSQAVMEMAADEATGWTFDPHSEASLQDALDRAFSSSVEDLKAKSAAARQRVREFAPAPVGKRAVHFLGRISGRAKAVKDVSADHDVLANHDLMNRERPAEQNTAGSRAL